MIGKKSTSMSIFCLGAVQEVTLGQPFFKFKKNIDFKILSFRILRKLRRLVFI